MNSKARAVRISKSYSEQVFTSRQKKREMLLNKGVKVARRHSPILL